LIKSLNQTPHLFAPINLVLMIIFKKHFDLYIDSSIQCGFLSVYAPVRTLCSTFADQSMANFAFFGTIGYNFVKYDALARAQKKCENEKSLPS
jgi:hypothetical protein